MRGTPLLVAAALALLSCKDSVSPLVSGTYILTRINGDSVPWYSPFNSQVNAGWIKLDGDTLAERHEESSGGPSTTSWTVSGPYSSSHDRLIIRYQRNPLEPGPVHVVDTFYVSGNGLIMRETGYPAPLDSMVRYYAPPRGQ